VLDTRLSHEVSLAFVLSLVLSGLRPTASVVFLGRAELS
jgi:hypothetical protein